MDEPGSAGDGCHPGDKIAHCATSQIGPRADYGLTGHDDVCFDVWTFVHLDLYADYLREKVPKLDSRAVQALLTTGGPRLMRVDGHYIEVHGPYPILMNVDGINIFTKAHVTDASDQVGRIYIGQEELKVR